MYSKEVVLSNSSSLYLSPAAAIVRKARDFKSKIWIEKDCIRVPGNSLFAVLSLGLVDGSQFKIYAVGIDEELAVTALAELVENGFVD